MWKIGWFVLFLFLCSCNEQSDINYNKIKHLDDNGLYTQRDNLFKSFPLEERLRVEEKFYLHSGHPPNVSLQYFFTDQPQRTFDLMINNLDKGKYESVDIYLGILYSISHAKNFNICAPENFNRLKAVLRKEGYFTGKPNPFSVIQFNNCTISSNG